MQPMRTHPMSHIVLDLPCAGIHHTPVYRIGGCGSMPPSRRAAKAFSVALLFLSVTVAASAQSIAGLKRKAAAGDAMAQLTLGMAYRLGIVVAEDKAEA